MWEAFIMSLDHTLGDAQVDLEGVDNSVHTQPNIILLNELGLYWQKP